MKIGKIVKMAAVVSFMMFYLNGCGLYYMANQEKANDIQNAKRLIQMGDTAYANQNYERSLMFYDKALALYEHSFIYKKIAVVLKKLGQDKEAQMVYQYSIKLRKKEEGGENR